MRMKDEEKRTAIVEATIKLVNEIGFVSASVSKIAREADVSPATLYIYYKNKEDLLVSTYVEIKKLLSDAILQDFNPEAPIRDILKKTWLNTFNFIQRHPSYIWFTEQFANSPFGDLVDRESVEKYFLPIIEILNRGIDQKIIKNVPFDLLSVFTFYPVILLTNPKLCKHFQATTENIELAFDLAWDAIKL